MRIFELFVVVASALGLTALTNPVVGALGGLSLLLAFALAISLSANGRLRTALDRYEQRALAVEFDSADPSCHHEYFVGPTGQNSLGLETYRVRVTNQSGRTVEGVTVSLERFAPQGAAFLPVPLRLMGDEPGPQSRAGLPVHPGSSRYFDVVALNFHLDGRIADLTIRYASQDPNVIDSGRRYEFSVVAEGRDVAACRRTFVAWIRSRRLYFCGLEDEATHPQRVTLPG